MNWNIRGCSSQCICCHKDFLDGDSYYCRLFLEAEGPRREDYCERCWEDLKSRSLSKEHSYWQGRFKIRPEPIEEEEIEEPVLKRLLKKWINSGERLHQCFCYIIALMLERNKTFQMKPAIKDTSGKEKLVYEDRDTSETYILENPGLTLKELDEIENELQDMLNQEIGKN